MRSVLNGTPRGGASGAGRSACSRRREEVAEGPTDVQILEVLTQRRDLSSRPRQLQVCEGCFVRVGSALYRWAVFLALIGVLRPHTFLTVASSKLVVTENVIVGVLAIAFLVPLATGTYDLAIGRSMSMALVIVNSLAKSNVSPVLGMFTRQTISGELNNSYPADRQQVALRASPVRVLPAHLCDRRVACVRAHTDRPLHVRHRWQS